jgi:IS605 OrfB family transposase
MGRDPDPQGYPNALDNFAGVGSSLEDFEESVRRLKKRAAGAVMPIYFSRSDGAAQTKSGAARNRNYSLLTTPQRDKLLAALWLLPGRHELCRPLGATRGNLIKVGTGEVFISNSSTAILVPLELGRNQWQQEKFIEPALNGKIDVQTAYLVRDDYTNDYFLHVSFAFPCAQEYEPQGFLGVDRGVFYTMAYAVVDKQGRILLMDHNEDGFRDHNITTGKRIQAMQRRGRTPTYRDYQQQEREAILHRLVNQLLDVAQGHQAKIVMEDLNIQIRGKFYKSAWRKFYKITEYKARMAGIPIWKGGIWAAYSSKICIYCGALNRGRKRDGSPFTCPECGEVYHSDEGAGVNIARRALYHKSEWEDRGGYRAFHRAFAKDGLLTTE